MAKSSELGPRRRNQKNQNEIIQKPVSGFQMVDLDQKPVPKSTGPKVDQSETTFQPPQIREKISAKNRATSIIQSQRRLQNSKKQVLRRVSF